MSIFVGTSGGNFKEVVQDASYCWDSHARGENNIVVFQLTITGKGVFERRGHRYEVGPGHGFVTIIPEEGRYYFPPEQTHPWSFAYINFYGELAIELWQWFRRKHGPVFKMPLDSIAHRLFLQLLSGTLALEDSPPEKLSALAYQFIMVLSEQQTGDSPATIQSIIQLLERRPGHAFAVKELATFCSLSREHFTRRFIAETGQSPGKFQRQLRLKHAQYWLAHTNLNVEEVARKVGLGQGRALTKLFKQQLGISPLQFRQQSRD